MAIHAWRLDGEVQIWSDCEADSETDGRCLGTGPTFEAAVAEARLELQGDLEQLDHLRPEDLRDPDVAGARLDRCYTRAQQARRPGGW